MHLFYPRYHAQSFYRNTFLVDKPQQIARAEKSDREWNNLAESGCHFTCLAMIAGVDPALLADAAIQTGYYAPDKDLPARARWQARAAGVGPERAVEKRQVLGLPPGLAPRPARAGRHRVQLPALGRPSAPEDRHPPGARGRPGRAPRGQRLVRAQRADRRAVGRRPAGVGPGHGARQRRGAGCRPWSPAACRCAPGPSARRCASSPSSSTSCGCASDGGSAQTLPGRSVCGSNCPEAPLYQAQNAIIVIAFECAATMPALRPDAGIQATAAADRHCHRATWCRRGGSSRRCPTTSAGCCPA